MKIEQFLLEIKQDLKEYPTEQVWARLSQKLVQCKMPFSVHWQLYQTLYPEYQTHPAPAWFPEDNDFKKSHILAFMKEKKISDYPAFQKWSHTEFQEFWETMSKRLNIQFDTPYEKIVDLGEGVESPIWFPKAQFNIVNSCFKAKDKDIAIISQTQTGELTKTTYQDLRSWVNQISASLKSVIQKKDRVAIIMPLTVNAIALYLAVIQLGGVVVCIAESFSIEEIQKRLTISETKLVFTQDSLTRKTKTFSLYEKLCQATEHPIIILPENEEIHLSSPIRQQDMLWQDFLKTDTFFSAEPCVSSDPISILFSSGTTGTPKAIPWTQITPLKCASDAYLHHNLQAGNVFCWPTSLGWMMGPWLIFATLINNATLALYEDAPQERGFGEFIQNVGVTHLGVIPSFVNQWHDTGCMEGLDWSAIQLFSSTGECSNVQDMLYLMHLAKYKPIIEYCGGTEIGGAYITGTTLQPQAPAAFTTKALGLDFVLLDDHQNPDISGEIALIPPSIGLSSTLINKNHHQEYYADMPPLNGTPLRRHGDFIKEYPNGFYRLLGRVDDTMNLGGIKISAVEIEQCLNKHPQLLETAAIGLNPEETGPTKLIIYAVPKKGQLLDPIQLQTELQTIIKDILNPLFKIHETVLIDALPRTVSNKIMRRSLRNALGH